MKTVCAAIPMPDVGEGEALSTKERQLRLENNVLAVDLPIKLEDPTCASWEAFLSAFTLAGLRRRTGAGFVLRAASGESDAPSRASRSDAESISLKNPVAFLRVCALDSDTLLKGAAAASASRLKMRCKQRRIAVVPRECTDTGRRRVLGGLCREPHGGTSRSAGPC